MQPFGARVPARAGSCCSRRLAISCTPQRPAGMLAAAPAAAPRGRAAPCAAAKRLVALDFDGVVCDSVGESSLSAFKAAAQLWPYIFATSAAEARKAELVEKMRGVRPVVETGYENIVQIRALYEGVSVEVRQSVAGCLNGAMVDFSGSSWRLGH